MSYVNRRIKLLQGLVWRAFKMKQLNIAVLIEDNISSELVDELYNEAAVEADQEKKDLALHTPEKFT